MGDLDLKIEKNLLLLVTLLSGCCSARTQILPKENGFLALAHSDSESCAFEECQKKAEEHCRARGKRFVLVKHDSNYQGMNKTAKGIMGGIGAASGTYIPTSTSEDYKVSMTFKCK
jgi:hypothetical protein